MKSKLFPNGLNKESDNYFPPICIGEI